MALSRDKILRAALEIVDRDGLHGLSMRKLGAELGVEAMSLYRYVTGKSDLLDGVFETVAGEVRLSQPSGDWHADARAAGGRFFEVLSRHPNALPLFASRPAVTPAALGTLERALAVLGQDGVTLEQALSRFNVLFAYILGFAMLQIMPDEVVEVDYAGLDATAHPQLSQLRRVLDGYAVATEFEKGLDAVLTGLAASGLSSSRSQ